MTTARLGVTPQSISPNHPGFCLEAVGHLITEVRDLSSIAAIAVRDVDATPCAAVGSVVRDSDGVLFRGGAGAFGRLWYGEDAPLANVRTVFDLASVTKPFTALTLARLQRKGFLSLCERLADVVPAMEGTASADVSLELLLSHRAGLDGHRPLYAPLVDGREVDRTEALRTAANARRPDALGGPPEHGFAPVYSDLGYLLIGEAIATRMGAPLADVVRSEVVAPLELSAGSAEQLLVSDAKFAERVAPTEVVPWRGGVIRGQVHDENAWAMAGLGMCGHAGLFGDLQSVLQLGAALLNVLANERSDFLSAAEFEPLVRIRRGGSLRAGFDSRTPEKPSSGSLFGARTFGHLGFTGTSLWVDPDAERVGVLLTNRVHPTRAKDAIRRARPLVYDGLVTAME